MEIRLAEERDLDAWMLLVTALRDAFPGLETEQALLEHRNTVLTFIRQDSAVCAKREGDLVGALLFSKDTNQLCFLAVAPNCRRQHIAEKMVSYMLAFLNPLQDVTATTYREDVPEGMAARAFYKHLGFKEGRFTEEFGSPVQEFVLPGIHHIVIPRAEGSAQVGDSEPERSLHAASPWSV